MTDFVTQLRRNVDERLRQLRPIVDEVRQLEEAVRRLGGVDRTGPRARRSSGRPAAAPQPKRRTSATRRSARRKRAPRGQNLAAILTAVGDQPGIKPDGLAEKTGIANGTVRTTVSKLKKDGRLKSDKAGGLRLARRTAGRAPQSP